VTHTHVYSCVLYEMCELTHAFNASNLLGLVWKIVKDPAPCLSSSYSPELAHLVRYVCPLCDS
jgi:NIMA (never in mitosis gene a)-related kinase